MDYTPDVKITQLGEDFYDPVEAAEFPKHILRYRDDRAAKTIGLDGLSDAAWTDHFGHFAPLKDNLKQPLALRYHGHQFRHYNPDIGDGRGFLFAQMRDDRGRLMDLGSKGSGTTPHSRSGDGRLTLLGGVREVLATRYLESLGVNTSKTMSLIETGEQLTRGDEPSPTRSAVMVRLSHGHIRFGTFQRQYFENAKDNLQTLTDYCLRHYYPDVTDKTPAGLLRAAAKSSADMVGSWMAAGFVHGVMNTDNMNISGESFDYGPYRFLPHMQADFTAAYFDHGKLYAFARQPESMYWNLAQLANCMSLIDDDQRLIDALQSFQDEYQLAVTRHMFRRLGVERTENLERDTAFTLKTFEMLENTLASWPQFFHDVSGQGEPSSNSVNLEQYKADEFKQWRMVFDSLTACAAPQKSDHPKALIYEQIGALWAQIDEHDDWSAFHAKLASFDVG